MNETDRNETEKINRALAEAMGFKVFRPSEVKWRNESQRDAHAWDTSYQILPPKKRPQTHMIDARPLPNFCESVDYAFQLVEWMRREKGVRFEIETRGKLWVVFIYEFSGFDRGANESLPTAISLVAARALGISLETTEEV